MRVVGLDLIALHLLSCGSTDADALRAWVYELAHRDFESAAGLAAAFRQVDLSALSIAIFRLSSAPVRIDTLIDFRTGVVLVIHVSEVQRLVQSANT